MKNLSELTETELNQMADEITVELNKRFVMREIAKMLLIYLILSEEDIQNINQKNKDIL